MPQEIADLSFLPGVVAIFRGVERKQGRYTGEPAWVVLVEEKRAPAQRGAQIPKLLKTNEGETRIDIVGMRPFTLASFGHGESGYGSIAAARKQGGSTYILLSGHVVAPDDWIVEGDGDYNDVNVNGVFGDALWSKFAHSSCADYAVAILPETNIVDTTLRRPAIRAPLLWNTALHFRSPRSGLISGRSRGYGSLSVVGYTFRDALLVEGFDELALGDSGSLVFRSNTSEAVGMVVGWADSNSEDRFRLAIVAPFDDLPSEWFFKFFR